MRYLFIHPVFGSQLYHIARHMDADPKNEVVFLSSVEHLDKDKRNLGKDFPPLPRGKLGLFNYRSGKVFAQDPFLNRLQNEMYQGQEVYNACKKLRESGYVPDIIVCHNYWGAALYLKDAYPEAKLVVYSEYFSTTDNVASCLDPGETLPETNRLYLRMAQANSLITLTEADAIITPTEFQKNSHPEIFHSRITVIHDGIDSDLFTPEPLAAIQMGERLISKEKAKIVTYVARDFESYRGFESFIKAAEIIQRDHPEAIIMVGGGVGGNGYGGKHGEAYFKQVMRSVKLDASRIVFMGVLSYENYRMLLQLSDVHVYLTVPFVLSWSVLEAMSCECAVVGSKTEPVEEVMVHEKNGLLAEFYNPQDIADKVSRFLNDARLRKQCGKAARKTVLERYAIAKIVPQYADFLGTL